MNALPDVMTEEEMNAYQQETPAVSDTADVLSEEEMERLAPISQPTDGGIFSRAAEPGPRFGEWSLDNPALGMKVAGGVLKIGASLIRNTVKTGAGMFRSLTGEVGGLLTGDESSRAEMMKPVDIPLIGQARSFSVNPEDRALGSASPEQMGGQAIGMLPEAMLFGFGASHKAIDSAFGLAKVAGKTGAAVGSTTALSEAMQQDADPLDAAVAAGFGALGGGLTGLAMGFGLGKLMGLPAMSPKTDGSAPGIAQFFTGKDKKYYQAAMDDPDGFEDAMRASKDETYASTVGQDIFDTAKTRFAKAQTAWKKSEAAILADFNDDLGKLGDSGYQRITENLTKEGIKASKGGLDFSESVFRKNPAAQSRIKDIVDVLKRPGANAEAVIRSRSALTDIMDGIPKEERNLLRVTKGIVDSYDETLNAVTSGKLAKMREAYSAAVDPLKKVMSRMTDDYGKLDLGKANNFVRSAIQNNTGAGMNTREVIAKLDAQAGTEFTNKVRQYGAARALSDLDPTTRSRVYDIVRGLGVSKIPLIGAPMSPLLWASMLKGNTKAAAEVSARYLQVATVAIVDWATKGISNMGTE